MRCHVFPNVVLDRTVASWVIVTADTWSEMSIAEAVVASVQSSVMVGSIR